MPYKNSLYYETFGNKKLPVAVFLHGFLGNGSEWNEIIETVSNDFYCITIDLPGHGQSTNVNDEEYNMAKCAQSVISILSELNLEKFNLVGYSMGGRLGLYIALHFPKLIIKLVLESASPGLKTEDERRTRAESDNKLAEEIQNIVLLEFLAHWYNQPIFGTLRNYPSKFQKLLIERQKNDPDGLAKSLKYMGTGVQPSLWRELSKLSCPTLLIVGEFDHKFQLIANEMNSISDRINIQCVSSAGHNVHFEQPDEYANVLKKFLK